MLLFQRSNFSARRTCHRRGQSICRDAAHVASHARRTFAGAFLAGILLRAVPGCFRLD